MFISRRCYYTPKSNLKSSKFGNKYCWYQTQVLCIGLTILKITKQVNPVVRATESNEFIVKCKQSVNKYWNHSWGWNILHNF